MLGYYTLTKFSQNQSDVLSQKLLLLQFKSCGKKSFMALSRDVPGQ